MISPEMVSAAFLDTAVYSLVALPSGGKIHFYEDFMAGDPNAKIKLEREIMASVVGHQRLNKKNDDQVFLISVFWIFFDDVSSCHFFANFNFFHDIFSF